MNSSTRLYKSFASKVNNLNSTRKKADKLFFSKTLCKRDINIIYSGLFVEMVTVFEHYIESLFIEISVSDSYHPSNQVKSKVTFNRKSDCKNVITGDKAYVDWLPFDRTKKRAKAYLRLGKPFTLVASSDCKKIHKISTIRNSIAHKSSHAREQLEKITKLASIQTKSSYLASEYLRKVFRYSPDQTYFEMHSLVLKQIAHDLAH